MPDGIIVITDREAASPHSRHADAFVQSAGEEGWRPPRLESEFPPPGPGVVPEGGYRGPDGALPPFPPGTLLVVLAEPAYWFDLSRAQKRRLDGLYHHLLAAGSGEGGAAASAVLFCSRDADAVAAEEIAAQHRLFCGKRGAIDRGMVRAACIAGLP